MGRLDIHGVSDLSKMEKLMHKKDLLGNLYGMPILRMEIYELIMKNK